MTFAANDNADDDTLEVHTIFDDDVEEEREIKSRVGYGTNFLLQSLNKRYTKSFNELSWKQKQNRTNNITKELIASCCNRKELKEDRMEYLEGNTALAMDVLTLIDLVKLKLESILKVDIISLDNTECYNDDVDEIDDSLAVALLLP